MNVRYLGMMRHTCFCTASAAGTLEYLTKGQSVGVHCHTLACLFKEFTGVYKAAATAGDTIVLGPKVCPFL